MLAASSPGHASPVRCVSEFDKVTSVQHSVPFLPNPLHNRRMFEHHVNALRLEADLHPMRLILSRLMANVTYNRRGLFNVPVDPVVLGLPDYFTIIKHPMDLGTVKKRLHSLEYKSRSECAEDIRLCFRNAMTYNPPNNTVHNAAREMLAFFEDQVVSFCPELALPPQTAAKPDTAGTLPPPTTQITAACLPTEPPSVDASVSESYSHTHVTGTRKNAPGELLNPSTATMLSRKRKKRGSKILKGHNCQWCDGKMCVICNQGCLSLEPTLLICSGPQCVGAKVPKGATYYIAPDGSCQFCQRCYAGLAAVLPHANKLEDDSICRYKRDLLKRKNDEEVVESWLSCSRCQSAVHQVCAMHNPFVPPSEGYLCPDCVSSDKLDAEAAPLAPITENEATSLYSFVSGSDLPVALSNIADLHSSDVLGAASLPETPLSSFIQEKVQERMGEAGVANAEKTVTVRVISDCERFFKVPDVVRKHFCMRSINADEAEVVPPLSVKYRSKAIAMFQTIDCLDVCIFCMYVHEYDGDDEFEIESDKGRVNQEKRVYIAYIDSVEYFRPRSCRTEVYHEVLSAYLATARKRGYETAHIWACPPSRGNSFVFWNHPAAQRTPNMDRLTAWYHGALSRSIDRGIVTDVKSLYESDFQDAIQQLDAEEASGAPASLNKMPCPPLLDGDFWVEEAVRVHGVTIDRFSKETIAAEEARSAAMDDALDPCPAVQVAAMLRNKIMALPSAVAFRRPVNAAALKLKDYHTIISEPMDLGTVYSRCALGEYRTLEQLVSDVNLVFANAKKYNPPGHVVHLKALELETLFESELNLTTKEWMDSSECKDGASQTWRAFSDTSLSLNYTLKHCKGLVLVDIPPGIEGAGTATSAVSTGSVSTSKNDDGVFKSAPVAPQKRVVDLRAGPQAVRQRMVGSDDWLLDKNPSPPKGLKRIFKRKKSGGDSLDEPVPKRRRQSWLGEEVGSAVRKMRTSFFKCSLKPGSDPEDSQLHAFNTYSSSFKDTEASSSPRTSRVADARHALLEFSQSRNLEFDTLRRAKYSSSMLLYHLCNDDAPGLVPDCTTCGRSIEGVRWHKIVKVVERRTAATHVSKKGRRPSKAPTDFVSEELCCSCYSKHKLPDQFIPLQVSFQN